MKRKKNLYCQICEIKNIEKSYDNVCSRLRNENVVESLKRHRGTNIYNIYDTLIHKNYVPRRI